MLRLLAAVLVLAFALWPATGVATEAAPARARTAIAAAEPPRVTSASRTPTEIDSIFAGQRVLTYYGNPLSSQMGVLGEADPQTVVEWLRGEATNYQKVDGVPVRPALHLIVTVAQGWPTDDGKYRLRMSPSLIREWVDIAAANDLLIFLDVQPGLSNVKEEVDAIRLWLTQPHVHLAVDPEFTMPNGKVPGTVIGTLDAAQINEASKILDNTVAQYNLPRKALVVYQFTPNMLTNKQNIVKRQNVDVVTVMDGFGSPELKQSHYTWYVADELIQFAGIKLFYRHDKPLMTPAEVLALRPKPNLIIYQ